MSIKNNILKIRENIDKAFKKRLEDKKNIESAAEEMEKIKIIAVTKNQPAPHMAEAIAAGIGAVGENRVQEALSKYPDIASRFQNEPGNLEWHLIGHLQTNKVRQAVELFDLIHSVDSERLAVAINDAAKKKDKRQNVLIQINVGGEDSKWGIAPTLKEVIKLSTFVAGLENIKLCGLMTVAPFYEEPELVRPIFKELRLLFDELRSSNIPNTDLKWLSMGMTNDYIEAIEEGANIVRIGTGIFGSR